MLKQVPADWLFVWMTRISMKGIVSLFYNKHHFGVDFAGKSWRDFSTMFWAMAQIAMVAVGLTLYF